jgi:hypothetical protein
MEWEIETRGDPKWIWGFRFFLVLSFFLFLVQKNFWGAGIILLISIVLFYFQSRQIKYVCQLSDEGIKIGDEIYPFSNLKSFWIDKKEGYLYLEKMRGLPPYLSLPFPKEMGSKIENFLKNFLEKVPREESWLEKFERKIGI